MGNLVCQYKQYGLGVPIIDARVRLPVCLRPAADGVPPEGFERYEEVLGLLSASQADTTQLWSDLNLAGIERAIIHAEYERTSSVQALNDATAALVGTEPLKLRGVGTVDLTHVHPRRSVREVRRCQSLGLVGINLQPAFFDLDLDDRRLYPIYAEAESLALVMSVHTGVHYSRSHKLGHELPRLLDNVAVDFPDLRLVACHAGWPWIDEMCAVVRRHPQVSVDFGGLAPKYVSAAGTGWSTLFRLMDNVLSEQVIFASDWPAFGPQAAVEQWKAAGLKQSTLDRLFSSNAATLYNWQ